MSQYFQVEKFYVCHTASIPTRINKRWPVKHYLTKRFRETN